MKIQVHKQTFNWLNSDNTTWVHFMWI